MKPRKFTKKRKVYNRDIIFMHRWGVKALIAAVCFSCIYLLWLPDVTPLKSKNPVTTATIENRKSELKTNLSLRWTPLASISPHVPRAVIVAEDTGFYTHDGVDFAELWIALGDALSSFELPRGASTITQQLAKNLYLSESYNPLRKVKEILVAKRLERQLGKKRILELYLNIIEWGDGIFGIAAASAYYFGVAPAELTPEQSAFLAAIIPNPRTVYNPKLNPGRVARRKQLILRRMKIS